MTPYCCILLCIYGLILLTSTNNGFRLSKSNKPTLRSTSLNFFKKNNKDENKPEKSTEDKDKKISEQLWLKPPEFLSKISWPNVLAGTVLGVVFSVGAVIGPILMETVDLQLVESTSDTSISETVTLFQDILVDLDNDYVDKINPEKLFKTGVKAMLQSLDPYTEFEDLKSARNMQESVSGKYGGVGLVISNSKVPLTKQFSNFDVSKYTVPPPQEVDEVELEQAILQTVNMQKMSDEKKQPTNGVVVADSFEGYAFEGGMRTGDKILAVDGVDARGLGVDGVRDLLRGDPETEVAIVYARNDYQSGNKETEPQISEVILRRRAVKMSDVRLATLLGSPDDGIGYINLSGFSGSAAKDFRNAFIMLRHAAPEDLNGLILDLRGNPGGLLDQAVEIASYLVPANSDIVSSRSKNGQEITYRSVIQPLRPSGMKLAVLVNKGSASAAEIVAGAIQDLDAGIVVGPTTTYGKGLVQKIVPLPFDTALKYTIAKYYTPSGRCIQAVRYTGGRDEPVDKNQQNSEKSEKEEEEEEELEINNVNGATQIKNNEKKTFYTINHHRPVQDAGGISPDYVINPIKVGVAEGSVFSQGSYSDFAQEFVKTHNIRSSLKRAAISEKINRDSSVEFYNGFFGPAADASFVLNPKKQIRGENKLRFFEAQDLKRSSPDEISEKLTELKNSGFFDQDQFNNRKDQKDIDIELGKSFGAFSPEKARFKKAELKEFGLNSKVPYGFFWGEAADLAVSAEDTIYPEFRKFVEKQMKDKDVILEAPLVTPVKKLEKTLKDLELTEAVKTVTDLKKGLQGAILKNMDETKSFIVDGVKLAILNQELPDRLIIYHTVVQDTQIHEAVKLLSPDKIPEKEKLKVTYESLLLPNALPEKASELKISDS